MIEEAPKTIDLQKAKDVIQTHISNRRVALNELTTQVQRLQAEIAGLNDAARSLESIAR